jgi:hypothetical protein
MWVQLPPLPLHFTSNQKEKMKKKIVDRFDTFPEVYRQMNVAESLDRIEELAGNFMCNPGQDLDDFLGDAEEVLELVLYIRAHLGLPSEG